MAFFIQQVKKEAVLFGQPQFYTAIFENRLRYIFSSKMERGKPSPEILIQSVWKNGKSFTAVAADAIFIHLYFLPYLRKV
jgi:hypothetical protein